jgi:capsule polysaccharide export protein KpsE/RkpR
MDATTGLTKKGGKKAQIRQQKALISSQEELITVQSAKLKQLEAELALITQKYQSAEKALADTRVELDLRQKDLATEREKSRTEEDSSCEGED